jgi:hypothetical protein
MAASHVSPLTRVTLMMSAIFLAVLAGLMVTGNRAGPADERQPRAVATSGIAAGPLQTFVAFAAGDPGRDLPAVGPDHRYTSEGIQRLTAALGTFDAGPGSPAARQLARFREQADLLRRDPRSLDHADIVRDVFTSASDIIEAALGQNASALRRSAHAIDPDRPLHPNKLHPFEHLVE